MHSPSSAPCCLVGLRLLLLYLAKPCACKLVKGLMQRTVTRWFGGLRAACLGLLALLWWPRLLPRSADGLLERPVKLLLLPACAVAAAAVAVGLVAGVLVHQLVQLLLLELCFSCGPACCTVVLMLPALLLVFNWRLAPSAGSSPGASRLAVLSRNTPGGEERPSTHTITCRKVVQHRWCS